MLPREVDLRQYLLEHCRHRRQHRHLYLGAQTLITGATTLSGTLDVTGTLSAMGNIQGNGAVSMPPARCWSCPTTLPCSAAPAMISVPSRRRIWWKPVSSCWAVRPPCRGNWCWAPTRWWISPVGLTVDTGAGNDFQEGLTLASGAVLEGGGTLAVGDFSASGMIDGTGTILALQRRNAGDRCRPGLRRGQSRCRGRRGDGARPEASLYGIFDTTPLTVQSGVTLNFMGPGSQPITGDYANPLGGTGGAFVISGPQVFSGTVTGFAVGDELIFPGLTGLVVHNISTIAGASSFVVSGVDSNGTTQSYTIFSDIPAGLVPAASFDSAGDADVVLHSGIATITSGGAFAASAGVAQPLLGLSLVLAAPTTQSLSITLSSAHGSLTTGAQTPSSRLTLTASNLSTLNAELAAAQLYRHRRAGCAHNQQRHRHPGRVAEPDRHQSRRQRRGGWLFRPRLHASRIGLLRQHRRAVCGQNRLCPGRAAGHRPGRI